MSWNKVKDERGGLVMALGEYEFLEITFGEHRLKVVYCGRDGRKAIIACRGPKNFLIKHSRLIEREGK